MKTILKNVGGILVGIAITAGSVSAQTIDEAKKSLENEEYNKTISIANQLATTMPKSGQPAFYRGMAFYKLAKSEDTAPEQVDGYLANARESFTAGIAKDKKNAFNLVGVGLVDIAQGKVSEGKSSIQKALETSGNDAYLLIEMAQAYLSIYNTKGVSATDKEAAIKEATTLLTKAEGLKASPETAADVSSALGDVWRTRGSEELALNKYDNALSQNPKCLNAAFQKGKLLRKQKKLNDAIDVFKKIVEQIDPKFAPAYKELAEILMRAGQFDNSKFYAKKYAELLGNDKYARTRYAQLLYLTNNYEDAITEFTNVLKDTSSFVIHRLLGYSLAEVKKYEDAKVQLDKAFALMKPEQIIAKDNRYYAKILLNIGQFDEADKYLAKVMAEKAEEGEDNNELYKDYYNSAKSKNEWERAVKYLTLYVKAKPNAQDQFNLAWAYYAKLKNPTVADSIFKIVTSTKPEVVEAHLYLGRINAKLDPETKDGTAKPFYEAMVTQIETQKKEEKYKKELIEGYGYLGYYWFNAGKDNNKSMEYYQKVQTLDSENDQAKKMIPYLKGQGAKGKE